MKTLLMILTIFGTFAFIAEESSAQVTPRADRRQRIQSNRIRSGVRSGQVTKTERRSIGRSVRSANRLERRAKSDGKVTWKERARIQHRQNKTSRKIYRTKHNNRTRH